jgi:hypothetical protein
VSLNVGMRTTDHGIPVRGNRVLAQTEHTNKNLPKQNLLVAMNGAHKSYAVCVQVVIFFCIKRAMSKVLSFLYDIYHFLINLYRKDIPLDPTRAKVKVFLMNNFKL